MTAVERCFTEFVNVVQKLVVPAVERRRVNAYPDPGPAFSERLRGLGLVPERFYRGGMTFDPKRAEILMDEIDANPPRELLELGCGNTTAILCALGYKHGFNVTSLENHPDSIGYVNYLLEGLPFRNRTNILRCGFARHSYPDGERYWWYDVDLGKLGKTYDLVFVDGPMKSLVGRNGALPEVWPFLASGWRLFLDDAKVPKGKATLAEWQRYFPGIEVQPYEKVWGCLAKVTPQPGSTT
ncbi:MAG: class I SAM-dependent methyltransferase [Burkholderiales bacterium]